MTTFWAESLAAGVDDRVFWDATPIEVCELRTASEKRLEDAERRADLRAGLVALQITNMARGKASTATRAQDFFHYGDEPDDSEKLRAALLKWAHETPGVTVQ